MVRAVVRHVQVEHAFQRYGDEAGRNHVRQGQEGVEDLRSDEDAAQARPFEDALVEEEDGHLAETQPDGVYFGTGKVDAPEVGQFPIVEGPVVFIIAVIVYCAGIEQVRTLKTKDMGAVSGEETTSRHSRRVFMISWPTKVIWVLFISIVNIVFKVRGM